MGRFYKGKRENCFLKKRGDPSSLKRERKKGSLFLGEPDKMAAPILS